MFLLILFIFDINVRESQRGKQQWTIQRYWHNSVH